MIIILSDLSLWRINIKILYELKINVSWQYTFFLSKSPRRKTTWHIHTHIDTQTRSALNARSASQACKARQAHEAREAREAREAHEVHKVHEVCEACEAREVMIGRLFEF